MNIFNMKKLQKGISLQMVIFHILVLGEKKTTYYKLEMVVRDNQIVTWNIF